MKPPVRVTFAPSARVVLRLDVYQVLPPEGLRGALTEQAGGVVCVTLDDGRDVLVQRSDLIVEPS